jgi:hypothetical protein
MTWNVLKNLICFRHHFDPSHCPWLLYSALHHTLVARKEVHVELENDIAEKPAFDVLEPLIADMSRCAFEAGKDNDSFKTVVWPSVCQVGGVWLGSLFVPLERCIWSSSKDEQLCGVLQRIGCRTGAIVVVEPLLRSLVQDLADGPFFMANASFCFLHGFTRQYPSLPFPTAFNMLVENVLPWLLSLEQRSQVILKIRVVFVLKRVIFCA